MKVFTAFALLVVSNWAHAATLTFTAFDQGWYSATGDHQEINNNISTGMRTVNGVRYYYNSFFNFDVSSLPAGSVIESVSLTIVPGSTIYSSFDPSETIELWDVTGPTWARPATSSERIAVYNDLMTGTKYGETQISATSGDQMPTVAFDLNSSSFDQISGQTYFSVGAHVSTIDSSVFQLLWTSDEDPTAILTVKTSVVPIPAAVWLFASGIAILGWFRRKI